MAIDIGRHKTILFQILKDIYTDTSISPFMGFKGGTAALLFYGLDRFSVDLDFDLLETDRINVVMERLAGICQSYGELRESRRKRFNLFFLLSYDDNSRNIKIEVNTRQFGSEYEIKTYLGVSMQVMVIPDMFAHKLMAMYERMGRTSRDIYDVWYFLQSRFPINARIVEKRSGMSFYEFIDACIRKLEGIDSRHILDGLGDLMAPGQKDRARVKMKEETIALLKLRLLSNLD